MGLPDNPRSAGRTEPLGAARATPRGGTCLWHRLMTRVHQVHHADMIAEVAAWAGMHARFYFCCDSK